MKNRAFTLVELLVVMAVLVLLAPVVVPSMTTITRGPQLTQAVDVVASTMELGRQVALAKSHQVEFRFYQYETDGAALSGSTAVRAVQLFEYKDDGTAMPIDKARVIPDSVVMTANQNLSSMFTTGTTGGLEKVWKTNDDPKDPKVSLAFKTKNGVVGTDYSVFAFRFNRDGTTSLNPSGVPGTAASGGGGAGKGAPTMVPWFVTFYNARDTEPSENEPPANFVTLRVEPLNGAMRVYRP